jgi:hypothetical protein
LIFNLSLVKPSNRGVCTDAIATEPAICRSRLAGDADTSIPLIQTILLKTKQALG